MRNPLAIIPIMWTEDDPPVPHWMDVAFFIALGGLIVLGVGALIMVICGVIR